MSAADKVAVDGIGSRSALSTTDKSTVVAAVNEINAKFGSVGQLKVMTQAEYDALATKDQTILYFVKEG